MTEDERMGNLYQRFPVRVARAEGTRVWDDAGKEYIDCMAGYGVALVGHRHPAVVAALRAQLDRVITVHPSLYSPEREAFLERLAEEAPAGLGQAHLNNSGAEAAEAALKMALKFTGRRKVVAMRGAYHGKTMGALSMTFGPKYRKSFEPLIGPVEFVPFGDADALRAAVGPDTAMVIAEPVQGERGIYPAPEGFLRAARAACDESGAVLAFDEIQSGLGRTGRMWAAEHDGVAPDVMCLAKGIAGGVPMGATLARPEILSSLGRGEHTSTFGGNPLSCAAGAATLAAIRGEKMPGNAASVGAELIGRLERLREKRRIIREVRGRGLMVGVELRFEVRDVLLESIKRGLLLLYSGRNILRLLPPLVLTRDDAGAVVDTLDDVLGAEEKKRQGDGGGAEGRPAAGPGPG